ncbi:MAG: SDR family NAD(P)-dependent oxidoreductase [Thermoleophilia bacterium]|nr:SDR family NAD(P)-dependent oxidoreductase [Thermoleophilia bacterium]
MLITGAGNGLGKAIAFELADRGAAVVPADRDEAAATEVSRKIEVRGGAAHDIMAVKPSRCVPVREVRRALDDRGQGRGLAHDARYPNDHRSSHPDRRVTRVPDVLSALATARVLNVAIVGGVVL